MANGKRQFGNKLNQINPRVLQSPGISRNREIPKRKSSEFYKFLGLSWTPGAALWPFQVPPHPGARIAIRLTCMGEWMVPRSSGIRLFDRPTHHNKNSAFFVFNVFEKTRRLTKPPHTYFLNVGFATWVTKLFFNRGRKYALRRNSLRQE